MSYLSLMNSSKIAGYNYSTKIARELTISNQQNVIELNRLKESLKKEYNKNDKRFVILGVPEGIGPYANRGRNGAYGAWEAFLLSFNQYSDKEVLNKTIILGNVYLEDLQRKSEYYDNKIIDDRKELSRMVNQIDERVTPILRTIISNNLVPIVIGGGHNNAYPLIKESAKQNESKAISCISLDLHADLRKTDGRHSGNSFSYAFENNLLQKYYIFGLHENYHSKEYYRKVENLRKEDKIDFSTYTQIMEDFQTSYKEQMGRALHWLENEKVQDIGLEVDLDSVEGVPASAITELRIPLKFTIDFVKKVNLNYAPVYFNLSEGAPDLGKRNSKKVVGDTISQLIYAFIENYASK